jgi:hypothetical protein
MISKDSSNSPPATSVDAYWLQTVMEDRAESAGPPPWLAADDDEEGDR